MNSHLLVWLCLSAVLTVLAFRRPVWGFSLYCLTSFAHPTCWWWGETIAGARVTLAAGTIFVISSVVHYAAPGDALGSDGSLLSRRVCGLTIALLANATMVHGFMAVNEIVSWETYVLQAKHLLFFILSIVSVRGQKDFRIMVMTLVVGLAYFGYEVVIRNEGFMYQGRLEGLGRPGFVGSNALAMMVIGILPLAGGMLFLGRAWQKVLGGFAAATGLEILVRCNSRGALIGLIAGGIVVVSVSRGVARRKLLVGVALALTAGLVLLNEQVINRFGSTFASEEDRDESASGRLILWSAGLKMIADRPLGAGGMGFKFSELGENYRDAARQAAGVTKTALSIHNGYLAQACDWGVQGLLLKLLLIAVTSIAVWKSMKFRSENLDHEVSLFGACILAAITCFLVKDGTGDHSQDELFLWLMAVATCYVRMYSRDGVPVQLSAEPSPSDRWATAS